MFTVFQKSSQKEYLVCRTCLKAGSGASYFKIHDRKCDGNDQIKISQMLDVIVPELVLSLTKFPDICLECAQCVSVSYRFRKKCLETENMIDTYMQNVKCTSSELNLMEVSHFAQSKLKKNNAQNIISDWEDDSSEDVSSDITIQPNLKKYQPNILTRHITKAKPETSTENQKNATNRNGRANPDKMRGKRLQLSAPTSLDNSEYVLVPEPTGVCRETGLFTDQNGRYYTLDGELMSSEEVEAIKKAVTASPAACLTVCEETGLFKNGNDEYFSPNGKLLDRQAVETEIKTAEVRGRHLFRIGEIFSVGEKVDSGTPGADAGNRQTLRIRDISSMIDKSVSSVQDVSAKKGCEQLRLRDISTMKSHGDGGEKTGENNSKRLRIVKTMAMLPNGGEEETNDVGDRFDKIQIPLKKIRIPRRKRLEDKSGKQHPERSLPPHVKTLPLLVNSPPLPETAFKVTLPQAAKTPLEVGDAETPTQNTGKKVAEIKKEPPDADAESCRTENNFRVRLDDEDTSSASETLIQENIQALIDSLDESDNYIDVPEFVQINKFTFKDLAALKEKGLAARKDTLPPNQNPPPHGTSDVTLKDLLEVGQADADGVEMLERLIADEIADASSTSPEQFLESPSKRRHRRSKVKMVPVAENPVVGTRSAYVERLVCVLRTPNREPEIRYPDREVCVLFTNYSEDGHYINDHDYLVTPYKRNMILTEENGVIYCKCFICGSKHKTVDHVPHMNSHDSNCPICNVNLGTGYMLNLHMKSHASVCRHCSELVAYPKIAEHARHHEEGVVHSFTSSFGEEPTAHPRVAKTSPCKKTPSRKKSTLEKSPSAKKATPDKTVSSIEIEVEPKIDIGVKVKTEKADSPTKKSIKRRKSTDEMIKEEYVDKRVLRSSSKKTECNEPPST